MTVQERAKQLIESIQLLIKQETYVQLGGKQEETPIVQNTEHAAKAIAIAQIKSEQEAVKNCFIYYTDLSRWDEHKVNIGYIELLAALDAFEPKSDEA